MGSHGRTGVRKLVLNFSSSKMIRACFSEQEYKKSPHCHDETWMTLNIRFKDIGQ